MFWKSLITGTVLALMAGSVVYFGTGGEIAQADIQRAMDSTRSATKSVAVTVKETIDDFKQGGPDDVDGPDVREAVLESSVPAEKPTEIFIFTEDTPDLKDEKIIDDSKERRWLSRYLTALKTEKENGPVKKTDAMIWQEKVKKGDVVPSLSAPKDVEFDDVYKTVLKQTAALEIPELRDRAYLSLIDYIIRHEAYENAPTVISKISQPELRDTARSNLAVGFARKGHRELAFEILEEVETRALQDVLRLQVIEAMTIPEPLNESAQ
jgi:hypothetical protein